MKDEEEENESRPEKQKMDIVNNRCPIFKCPETVDNEVKTEKSVYKNYLEI